MIKYLTVGSRVKQPPSSVHFLCKSFFSSHEFKSPSHQTLDFLAEKCLSMREIKLLQAQLILHGLTNVNLTLGKLVSFCAVDDAGDLQYAQLMFDQIPQPNKFMYNSLIRGYANSDDPIKAVLLFRRMVCSGLSPNEYTLPFVLKACACKSLYWEAVLVHGVAIKLGIGSLVFVQNALLSVYDVCGLINYARKVFDDITVKTLVSWNSMIGGYSRMGDWKEAFWLFRKMREWGMDADGYTLVNLLSVCSQCCDLDLGRYVHFYIEITGVKIDNIVRNALMDMYAKCGDLHSAQAIFDRSEEKNVVSWTSMICAYAQHGSIEVARQIFDRMPGKNVVSWNSMISCYIRAGQCRKALNLFSKMCNSRVATDEGTLVSILAACSRLGDLVMGKKIHNYILSNKAAYGVTSWNSLIDMYAKCGRVATALDIFSNMPEKDLVSWNVIIGALALHGCGFEAIKLFEKMQADGLWPDRITLTGLLNACSHSGLVDMGRYYFDRMNSIYKVPREIEHYACMVDLLGRGGFLGEAIALIGRMPMKPDVVVWGALLGACRIHGNVEIGKSILKQILELEPHSGGLYVLISNMYWEAQRWEDVRKIRRLMKDHGIKKVRALSSIEIDGRIHEFMVADKSHKTSSGIYEMLDQLTDHLKSAGYLCNISSVLFEAEES